jgi:hypothetical protein
MKFNMTAALIGLGVVFVALAVYYLIPNIYHPLTFSPPYESHKTHALALGAVAVICFIASRFARNAVDSGRP